MTTPLHPAKILIIDDEPQMQRLLQRVLSPEGYRVVSAATGEEGRARAATERPEIIVLDLGLPDMSGMEVLKTLRGWSSVPVLVLSVIGSEETIVAALDGGADDYLTKPFRAGELLARIRALLRHRASGRDRQVVTAGPLTIDLASRAVTVRGEPVRLTPTEFSLLALFGRNIGRVLTHAYILQNVWGPASVEESQYTRVYVGQLRKKIEVDPANPRLLLTESGIGYRLVAEPFDPMPGPGAESRS